MALPKIEVMHHTLTLPSTGKELRFRPFLVKEEKILMMAMQSGEAKDIISALKDIISNCLEDDIKVSELAMFDFEYIFLQLRARSVGDSIDIKYSDPEFICSKDNKECLFSSTINIDEIKIEKVKIEKELVDITDTIKVKLRWPKVDDTAAMGDLTGEGVDQEKLISSTFSMIGNCIEYIMDGKDMHKPSDYSEKEVDDFLNSLSSAQFKSIQKYFESLPKLRKEVVSKCSKCGNENIKKLEGVNDFFAWG
tara:strand:+ start:34 stop:786 length:753 start_codon:yes stop_codon:yes gene_type:complete